MEHSQAVMDDAGKAIGGPSKTDAPESFTAVANEDRKGEQTNNHDRRKRKGNFHDAGRRHGSNKGRNGDSRDEKRHKKGDMGRGEYFASNPDKRQRTDASRKQREEGKGPQYGTAFSKEEIDAEERRPKRKVAVLIGYSGTGYKGMQISTSEKTIEGDLFNAFIAAGAISKANADDPKKASLVRCARTDKGVHAAGNMISLKLIVEDENIVQKINDNLTPQIRVWGIERTIGSFSCYQACDSRWYEYLIPSYAFLPPHPSSYLAKKLEECADQANDRKGYESRQAEVLGFWEEVEKEAIKPILESIDDDIRFDVIKALQGENEASEKVSKRAGEGEPLVKVGSTIDEAPPAEHEKTEEAAIIINEPSLTRQPSMAESSIMESSVTNTESTAATSILPPEMDRQHRLRAATKLLRQAYNTAKRHHRIPAERIKRIQDALTRFVGTSNYHNFTIQKTFRDPSAKRHIKSFVVNPRPILIGDGPDAEKTEWLSLKVHGQSFMMHQIRKMVGMVTLLVRAGADVSTLTAALGPDRYSIPKVPGLGLLLERPVFDSYNNITAPKHGREKLEFSKYEEEMEAFKERDIYQKIFAEEEEKNEFVKFFNHVDNYREKWFLYVTSMGLEACKGAKKEVMVESDDEGPVEEGEE